jgi:predicted neutral ceramidase superfamily lipid hydrolase
MLDSFLAKVLFAIIIIWFIIFVVCLVTLSRRKDLSLPEKVFWAVVIFFAPVIGLMFYLVFASKRRRIKSRR